MARKTKSGKREAPRVRRERRFVPQANVSPWIALSLGGAGALVMGAGSFELFFSNRELPPLAAAPYLLVVGSILVAVAIWIGTSGEPLLRVGDAGVGIEKRNIRRIPWYAVERIEWRGEAIRLLGKDESEVPATLVVPAKTHAQAAAWIVKEARERIPAVVDVPVDATLPPAHESGETFVLDSPLVVGKACAASGVIISYEPDGRVCPRCERIYHVSHIPALCACGGSLRASAPRERESNG